MNTLSELIERVPPGYTRVRYRGQVWGMRRRDFNAGKSVKIYAEQLGGTDFISCNYYQTSGGEHFKPCEMPAARVLDFLRGFSLLPAAPEDPEP